jgi:ABC-type glycerol-3-phosphate transport system substrate-binding protein
MKFSFQTFLIGFFILAFIGAVLVFAGIIKVGNSGSSGVVSNVRVWGIYPQSVVNPYLDKLNIQNKNLAIFYEQKSKASFKSDLINALANGNSPDIVLADAGNLFSFRDKLYTIGFDTYSERLFRDSFVDGASLFLNKEGVMALPILVDPVVLYYNKDLLAGKNFVVPPKSWSSLVDSLPLFNKKDSKGILTQTTIGMGEFSNVNHYKDILSTLFLQTGSPIVALDLNNNSFSQRLNIAPEGADSLPTAEALDFYLSFSNQATDRFSWTRNLPNTLDMFLSGKSVFYIGRASELFDIQARNPNLNFDVTSIFQSDQAVRPITFGEFSGIAIIKSSPNFTASYTALGYLNSKEFLEYLSSTVALPSAKRDLLLVNQKNPYVDVFFKSTLSAFGWPDIDPSATEGVFRDMIRSVNSGANTPVQAIYEASRNLQSIVR